jgi:hypothetical protein
MITKKKTSRSPSARATARKSAAKTASSMAGKAKTKTARSRKPATAHSARSTKAEASSPLAEINKWVHRVGRKLKTVEKKVVKETKMKLRRLLHRPQTSTA